MNKNTYFILALIFAAAVKADIPVHCLKSQVIGDWVFERTAPVTWSPKERDHLCGHQLPDNARSSNIPLSSFQTDSKVKVHLGKDSVASDLSSHHTEKGKWTMVYDEGFDFTLNDVTYFAFSKFYEEDFDHKSDCSKTLDGWYHDLGKNEMGCFRGHKADGSEQINGEVKHDYVVQPKEYQSDNVQKSKTLLKTEPIDNYELDTFDYSSAKIEDPHEDFLAKNPYAESNTYLEMNRDFEDHHLAVERLNNAGNSWTAKYHDNLNGQTLAQLNSKAGISRSNSQAKKTSKSRKSQYPSQFETDDVSDLPAAFSWKEKLAPNREQKDCGSCYIFATLQMLQSRLKIKHNENVELSVQHVVDCSVYNQGCDGGYPYLVNKFASEYELVPNSCHAYAGETTGKCSKCDVDSLSKTYKVKDYKFIGGSYGKANERNMMIELQKNGPVVASFEPGYDFMFYDKGIYHQPSEDSWVYEQDTKPEWEKVDHSVLLYGWGEENGEKYWELQNTWGSAWGENGHFRMRRGVDDSAIESLAEASTPYIVNKSSGVFLETNEDKQDEVFYEINQQFDTMITQNKKYH